MTSDPEPERGPTGPPSASVDPVLARRAQLRRLASVGQRIGYLLFGVAVVAFFYGFFVDFSNTVATVIVASIAVGSIALAPAIVLGYAVKAADREDREMGR